jgi:hypothetical protein
VLEAPSVSGVCSAAMRPVSAELEIAAPAERVWAVLVDVERYREWNRFTPRLSLRNHELAVGAELDLDCLMTDHLLLRDEHEVILELDAERFTFCMGTSRTRGRPGIMSRRTQRCTPLGPDRTLFFNAEEFHGPLSPLVYLLYRRRLAAAFRRYCLDLQVRVALLSRLEPA